MVKKLDRPAARRELLEGESEALLRELHLLTRDGQLNADARRKLKQVNHFVTLLGPALTDVLTRFGEPLLLDAGAGKSYLGFVLYELALAKAGKGRLLCVETREELVRDGEARAKRLGFDRLSYVHGPLESVELPARLHLVVALHACDTATDDAIVRAVRGNADHVALVPCCQAEVARQLDRAPDAPPWDALWERPLHKREFGSHLTNVLRVLALQALGYRVTVTELTGWEHSLKNELILGEKIRREDPAAKARLRALLQATGARPKLVRDLKLLQDDAPVAESP